MDQRVKELWVNKLRDPATKQAKGVLEREDGGQCCLGVLCNVLIENEIISLEKSVVYSASQDENVNKFTYLDDQGNQNEGIAVLPNVLYDELGLLSEDGLLPSRATDKYFYDDPFAPDGKKAGISLAELNDNGYTFSQIADIIEAEF